MRGGTVPRWQPGKAGLRKSGQRSREPDDPAEAWSKIWDDGVRSSPRCDAFEASAVGAFATLDPVTLPEPHGGAGRTERLSMDAIFKKRNTLPSDARAGLIRPSREDAEAAVRTLIAFAGDDPEREGLIDTPKRVVAAYEELYSGYRENAEDVLDRTFSETGGYDDLVLVRGYSVPLALRAPHDAVFRDRAHRLSADRAGCWIVEAGAPNRRVLAAATDAGASQLADCHINREGPQAARRRRDVAG